METWDALLACLPLKVAAALEISLETGLRISDVLELKREDIRGNTIYYTAKKTGKSGTAQISEGLRRKLDAPIFNGLVWLFTSPCSASKHLTRQTVWRSLKLCAKRFNLRENVAPHSARKTFAVEEFAHKNLDVVRQELQHDRISTTLMYALADKLQKADDPTDRAANVREFADMVARRVVELIKPRKR